MIDDKLLYLLLGWSLGILSPTIIDCIKKHKKINENKTIIKTELKQIRYILTTQIYKISDYFNKIDHDFLKQVDDIFNNYKGLYASNTLHENIKILLDKTPEELAEKIKTNKPPNAALLLRTIDAPFINSNIDSIGIFDSEFQKKLLDIRSQLNMLNQQVLESKQIFYLTFDDSMTDKNHLTVLKNLEGLYKQILERSNTISNSILDNFLTEKEKPQNEPIPTNPDNGPFFNS